MTSILSRIKTAREERERIDAIITPSPQEPPPPSGPIGKRLAKAAAEEESVVEDGSKSSKITDPTEMRKLMEKQGYDPQAIERVIAGMRLDNT